MPNELWIYDVIGSGFWESGVTDKSVRDDLKKFKDTEPLTVRIQSPGGDVMMAVAIKTMLDQWKGPVNIQIDGLAASSASYIAMSGSNTTMAEGGLMMLHNPWTIAVGDAKDMRKQADVLDKVGDNLAKAYAGRTGKSLEEIKAIMDAESWFTADEALELGLIHGKLEEAAMAYAIPEVMGFKNAPKPAEAPKQRTVNRLAAMQRQLDLAKAVAR